MNKKIILVIIVSLVILSVFAIRGINSSDSKSDNNSKIIDKSEDDSISKEYIEQEKMKEETSSKLSFEEAIELCKQKYGDNEDTLYEGENKIVEIDGNRGYLIQILSKNLMEQGGTGVLFSVIVTEDGNIIEIE